MHQSESGAALAYVLGLFILLGCLTGYLFQDLAGNFALVRRESERAQGRLLAHAGLDYGLSRVNAAAPLKGLDLELHRARWEGGGDGGFRVDLFPHGLSSRLRSESRPEPRKTVLLAELGQELDLALFPALALTNKQGSLVLAGAASIEGPVLLWKGSVRRSSDYRLLAQGGGHAGPVWDSTSRAWDQVGAVLDKAERWMQGQEACLASGSFRNDPDSAGFGGAKEWTAAGDIALPESTWIGSRLLVRGRLRIPYGTVLRRCKVVAEEVVLDPGCRIVDGLLFARHAVRVRGGTVSGGQILAGDSLLLGAAATEGFPVFYARGRLRPPAVSAVSGAAPPAPSTASDTGTLPDRALPPTLGTAAGAESTYTGGLFVTGFKGEALLFFAGRDRPSFDQEARIRIDSVTRMTGLIHAQGMVDFKGTLEGSLVCDNLRGEAGGTIYFGHLLRGRLRKPASLRIPSPLVFPLTLPARIRRKVPS